MLLFRVRGEDKEESGMSGDLISKSEVMKIIYDEIREKSSYIEHNAQIDIRQESPNIANLAVLVAAYTGMRAGEVVALKWEDIAEKYIYVHRTQIRYRQDGKDVYEVRDFPKTEAGIRKIVIVENLKPVLKRLRLLNPFSEYAFIKDGEVMKKCVSGS